MKKLPVGIQTFSKIIESEYLYIDKTEIAYNLINNYEYVFLSRPRRFGKSLFLDTLRNIFEGKRELFDGLLIYDKWNWDKKHPVIKIAFGGTRSEDELKRVIISILKDNMRDLGVECESVDDYAVCFKELIFQAYQKYGEKVVILIDEYDKPILDNLDQDDVAIGNREILKRLYTEIKMADEYIRFAFLTGVSKFSKSSIFSGLNNLTDISLNPDFGNICGYTQNDVETAFEPYLDGVDMNELKIWYNGYNFLGDSVYNPFDILLFIKNKKIYRNYWFETGTPSFLIKLIKNGNYYLPNFEDLVVGEEFIGSFDIDDISLETLMFQSGYLTIKEVIQYRGRIRYRLMFPNLEVKMSFSSYLLRSFANNQNKEHISNDLFDIFHSSQIDKLESVIRRLFASIAYNNFTKNEIASYEGFYASVLYAYFSSLGIEMIAEDVTNRGRMDLTLKMNNRVYIFEFKMSTSNEEPLKQIYERRYFEKYISTKNSEVEVYIVGIVFDGMKRNISNFEYKRV